VTTILPALDAAARAAIAQRTEMLFREAGALREGHFLLKSGRHGDRYLEKFQVLQFPAAVSELCGYMAARGRAADGELLVDVAAGPTTGGVILAFEVARQLGVRGIFAEEERADDGTARRLFRRGFAITPGQRVLIVDDILTTGGSLLTMLEPVEEAGGEIVGVGVLVDRSGGTATVTSPGSGRSYPVDALWSLDLPTYEPGPGTCPACREGLDLIAPGSGGAAGA
jgi:orotate phosphoribosyltransferase